MKKKTRSKVIAVDVKSLYRKGQIVEGTIGSIFKAGAQHPDASAAIKLQTGGTALLLFDELPDYPRNKIAEVFKVGDRISAEVIAVRPSKNRVTVSLKPVIRRQTLAQLAPGYVVLGKIVKSVGYGYFVSIGGGIEALLHNDNLQRRHHDAQQDYSAGAEIKVVILAIEEDGRRVAVGRKQLF